MNGFHLPEDRLPRFFPLPERLLTADLTLAELRVYLLLLRRSFLSARSPRWVDGDGRVYLYYPIQDLTKALDCGRTCVITALKGLEEKDLILRVRQGVGKASRIYVKFPAEEEPYDPAEDALCGLTVDAMPVLAADAPCVLVGDGTAAPSNIERRERKELYEGKEKGEPSPAEAQSADFREDGKAGREDDGEHCAEAPSTGNGRERRRFRRRENCSFPLKPAVDWFRMVLSKKRKGDIAYD